MDSISSTLLRANESSSQNAPIHSVWSSQAIILVPKGLSGPEDIYVLNHHTFLTHAATFFIGGIIVGRSFRGCTYRRIGEDGYAKGQCG